MKQKIRQIVSQIPKYNAFLTVKELNQSSRELAKKYPELVELFTFGKSRKGDEILGLKIGNGSKNALVFGFPHPNEPVGTMTMEFLTELLATDQSIRDELDYTWYFVKAWDSDGAKLNENWFKGPYSIYHYARNFFRPAGHQQVDWTFPIDYKKHSFHDVLPETSAMMDLIDRIKPAFIYSLHNAGFGGVYWYITRDIPKVYTALYQAAKRQGIPLHLGEPEAPFCETFLSAIYKLFSVKEHYDYLEKFGVNNPSDIIKSGNSSAEYAFDRYNSFTLLTELPYFYNDKIFDQSESDVIRGDLYLEMIEERRELDRYVMDSINKNRSLIADDNPFLIAIEAFVGKEEEDRATIKMATEDPAYRRRAKVSEVFDMRWVARFYQLLFLGLAIRAHESEIDNYHYEQRKALEFECKKLDKELKKRTEQLESESDYKVIDIEKLVAIQVECGLIVADYLNREENYENT